MLSGDIHGNLIIGLCLLWAIAHLYAAFIIARIPRFRDTPIEKSTGDWPLLSVIIPARNEGHTIEAAAQTLLQQDYPNLEVILVNDRSDDDTGAIIDQLVANDPRLRAVHIDTLPEGWLGKVHALEQGIRAASGEWLLLSDADIHFRPDTLRRALSRVRQSGCGHLTLMPDARSHTLPQAVVMAATRLVFAITARLPWVRNPRSKAAIGIGAFNLLSRHAYEQTPGMEWLKMEVVDDVGMGVMLKQHGICTDFAYAPESVWLSWYPNLPSMINGLEKNLYGVAARYRPLPMLIMVLTTWLFALAPLLALLQEATRPWALLYLILLVPLLVARWRFSDPVLPALLAPLGHCVLGYMLLRSGWHCIRRGGIRWRDTFYPTEKLKAGQRVKL